MKVSTNQERLNELFDADPRNDTAIAEDLHVSKQALSAWRNGIRSPKKSMLEVIAEKYNVSIEWLMGFDVEKTPSAKEIIRKELYDYYDEHGIQTAEQPKNDEIRLLVRDLNKLSPEQVEQAKSVFRAMFKITNPELFTEDNDE